MTIPGLTVNSLQSGLATRRIPATTGFGEDNNNKDFAMSAFVPGYQHDIFVSYARVDDLTYPGINAAGWVATLIAGLNVNLSQQLGRSDLFSLWKDQQLSPNKPLTPEILTALKQSRRRW